MKKTIAAMTFLLSLSVYAGSVATVNCVLSETNSVVKDEIFAVVKLDKKRPLSGFTSKRQDLYIEAMLTTAKGDVIVKVDKDGERLLLLSGSTKNPLTAVLKQENIRVECSQK